MDVQILNEIAGLARKAPPPQVGAPVSGNAQLKALKGSPVPSPGNPAPPSFEDPPESGPGPVTPDISSVARAASAYSAAVNNGLNSDEINAIQNLAGQIRPAIADFLNQPGLEQAENAEAVVVAHPEAVQNLQADLEQAVAETFSAPALVDNGIVSPEGPHEQTPVPVAPVEISISVERVTQGAEPDPTVPVIAASPAIQNTQARVPANVDNPVTVAVPPETSSGDFTVSPASPAIQNTQAGENTNAETPVSRSEPPTPQQSPQSQSETVATTPQNTPVTAASPAIQNAQARKHTDADNPVKVTAPPETSSREFTVGNSTVSPASPASPAIQNAHAGENTNAETPVSRSEPSTPQQSPQSQSETVATTPQSAPVIAASPALQNAQAREHTDVNNPVKVTAPPETSSTEFTVGNSTVSPASPVVVNNDSRFSRVEEPVAVEGDPENSKGDFTGIATSPARVIPQSAEEVRVENPVNRPETVASPNQEATVSHPETVAANSQPTPAVQPETRATTQQDTPVTAASPALQNARADGNANAGTPVSRPEAIPTQSQQAPVNRPETRATTQQSAPVSPAIQNARAGENANAGTPVNRPEAIPTQSQQAPVNHPETRAATQQDTPVAAPAALGLRELISDSASAAVNPENVRDVNALVNSVVENEFTAEAKKIFSQPKIIRTVADLADFILERLREIILTKQLEKQSASTGES